MTRIKKSLWYWGIAVQVIATISNGIIWCIGLYSTGFAIVVGLSSGTISIKDSKLLDWIVLTPATLFLFYGIPLFAIATFGCFATISANYIAVIIYAILIILYVAYDVVYGKSFIGSEGAYDKFISSLKQSQYAYGKTEASDVGIYPVHPNIYWDHLQKRGKCCGLSSYVDWRNTSIAKDSFSIPDSCCTEQYDYDGCGVLIWKHPDHKEHTIGTIINERGCLSIFPTSIQSDEGKIITNLGRFLIAMLYIALITAIVLFALVLTRKFRTSTGINNPDFIDVQPDPSFFHGREIQVHPASGDQDYRGFEDSRGRTISFDDKGPTLINERRQHMPMTNEMQYDEEPSRRQWKHSPSSKSPPRFRRH